MPPSAPPLATTDQLIALYDAFLLDAYGVLVEGAGPCLGAAAFLQRLDEHGKPWRILSNDASKTPESAAARYQGYGLPVHASQVLNAAGLLPDWFAERGLRGARCRVLGTADSCALVTRAGGHVAPLPDPDFSVLVLCDEAGYPLLEILDDTLTCVVRALQLGRPMHLVLPNPDLTYPKARESWGFASGSLAALLEGGIAARFSDFPLRFQALGKPHPALFQQGLQAVGPGRVLMIGDQPATDMQGAHAVGIDSALALWGVTAWPPQAPLPAQRTPTWLLAQF